MNLNITPFKKLFLDNIEMQNYLKSRDVKLYNAFAHYRQFIGNACPYINAVLKVWWADEVDRDPDGFNIKLIEWGYSGN